LLASVLPCGSIAPTGQDTSRLPSDPSPSPTEPRPAHRKRPNRALALLGPSGEVRRLRAVQTHADRVHGGLGAVRDAELREDVADVGLDGLLGDAELAGDALVREAAGDEREDLLLAAGEALGGGFARGLG